MTKTTTPSAGCLEMEQQQQQRQQQQHQLVALPPLHPASFDKLDPSRKDDVYLYYEEDVKKTAASTDGQQGSSNSSNYRYKLTIVDRPIIATATNNNNNNNNNKLAYATAVFLIPAGREAEYMFSSIRGLQNIAASAGTARLIAVAFGRHDHVFASQQAVQQELTYVVQILARQGSFLLSKKSLPPANQQQLSSSTATVASINDIPFMALDGIGQRNVIAQGSSAASGPYLVEQVTVDDNAQVRRLYFMNNPFVIQTEVFLSSRSSNSSTPTLLAIVDKSRAAFDYHKIMAAGILALSSSSPPAQAPLLQGLLIGLGGGGLVNYMSHVWPPSSSACMLTAIELDPTMVDIATMYFGVAIHKKTETNSSLEDSGNNAGVCLDVRIGNGLDISVARDNVNEATNASITVPAVDDDDDDDNTKQTLASERTAALAAPSTLSFATGTMSFVVIDVDSKDNSKGMSCPPQSFIEVDYLKRLSQLLLSANETGGVLAINVSARDPEMLQLVCRNVNQVFDTVILSNNAVYGNKTEESSEDVNVVVFAMKLSRNENDDDHVLSRRSVLTDRLATLLRLNPNVTDECMSDLKSAIHDFSLWKSDNYNDDDDGKSQHRGKKAGGGEGRGKKNKTKNKRGGKKK